MIDVEFVAGVILALIGLLWITRRILIAIDEADREFEIMDGRVFDKDNDAR